MKKHIFTNSQGRPPAVNHASHEISLRNVHPSKGDAQPPRKNTAVNVEIRIMLAYSARKNNANATPEYSTWKPATISDSPSATSNGARLVSATPAIQYTTNNGNSGKMNHWLTPPDWAFTMSPIFRLPPAMSTPTSAKPIAIS